MLERLHPLSGKGSRRLRGKVQTLLPRFCHKKGRVEKAKKLLQTIAFVRSNSVTLSIGPLGVSKEAQAPNLSREAVPLDVVPLDTQFGERRELTVGPSGAGDPPLPTSTTS